jgi:hypothetical protein
MVRSCSDPTSVRFPTQVGSHHTGEGGLTTGE